MLITLLFAAPVVAAAWTIATTWAFWKWMHRGPFTAHDHGASSIYAPDPDLGPVFHQIEEDVDRGPTLALGVGADRASVAEAVRNGEEEGASTPRWGA